MVLEGDVDSNFWTQGGRVMGRKSLSCASIIFIMVMGLLVMGFPGVGYGVEEGDDAADRPLRLVEMAVEYSGVEVPVEESVSMDVIFYNKGRSGTGTR
jgi:hypothetical protein